MQIGPDIYYKCPHCANILWNRSLASGNTFGATFLSDGYRMAPMLPYIPVLTKCPKCNTILWLNDLRELGESRSYGKGQSDNPEWQDADRVDFLELEDLWRALGDLRMYNLKSPEAKRREIYIRQQIWWAYNRKKFDTTLEIDSWRKNCQDLIAILNPKDNDQLCMTVELYRNLCNFPKCLQLAKKLPANCKDFQAKMIEECEKLNPLTVVLREKKYDDDPETFEKEQEEEEVEEPKQPFKTESAYLFYSMMADKCHVEAQYLFGKLNLDETYYNLSEAIRWLEYAAFQGYKPAIIELDSLQDDEDGGKYDAYV